MKELIIFVFGALLGSFAGIVYMALIIGGSKNDREY